MLHCYYQAKPFIRVHIRKTVNVNTIATRLQITTSIFKGITESEGQSRRITCTPAGLSCRITCTIKWKEFVFRYVHSSVSNLQSCLCRLHYNLSAIVHGWESRSKYSTEKLILFCLYSRHASITRDARYCRLSCMGIQTLGFGFFLFYSILFRC